MRRGGINKTLPFFFNKICVFCNKCYVRIDKCGFIIVKIKYLNSGRINDICNNLL